MIPEDEEAFEERRRNYKETPGCRRMCACGNANKKDGMKEEKIRCKQEGPMVPVFRFSAFPHGINSCISSNRKLVNRYGLL